MGFSTGWLPDWQTDWPTNQLTLFSDKYNTRATGLITLPFNAASSHDMHFFLPQWLQCLHHGSTNAYVSLFSLCTIHHSFFHYCAGDNLWSACHSFTTRLSDYIAGRGASYAACLKCVLFTAILYSIKVILLSIGIIVIKVRKHGWSSTPADILVVRKLHCKHCHF